MQNLLERYPVLNVCSKEIDRALELIIKTYEKGGKVLVCGNGGSAADCEHIVGELMKSFMINRKVEDERIPRPLREKLQGSLPAISLPSQSGVLSAFINDAEAEMMYAQLVYGYGRESDLLIALSTSGNSKNVLRAVEVASGMGIDSVALTGESGGKLKDIATVTITVPEKETYKVQELHLPVYHYLCQKTEKHFFEVE